MTVEKGSSQSRLSQYLIGILMGIISSIGLLYMLNILGVIAISSVGSWSPVVFMSWCYSNLGLSMIPFSLIAVVYVYYLVRLNRFLGLENPTAERIFAVEEKIDLLMSIFFGVGVIWTAIGMRNALLASLGNIDAEIAAQKGAFYILQQLVEGGILLSLSTTIVGGVGGYLMRMIKAWFLGARMNAFMDSLNAGQSREVLDRLDKIADLLKNNNRENGDQENRDQENRAEEKPPC